ncbi:hypothetical protein BCR36DRAFT_361730 [Piromyces finnis]|uniref:Uncharacterized protein n=1 Tax=Piromyces finnis TaxID=1754191 RepID=A0A1Y1UXP6_9FUNG|nr:hypothetical protein BCR36DRAFT_361730 [Piromyces finnis]|eukprot:ORX43000.1 hypothetical protein BCR36DRAFT_361730 [Piromyces finnis]
MKNKEEWETYYSDEEDYNENMKNLNIESNDNEKGKNVSENKTNQHEIIEQYDSESVVEEEQSFDESSITNYSIDYSMISDMNDFSFLNGQNLSLILNNTNAGNTLEDEINDAIDKEYLINPETSLIAKTFFNSNDETDLSSLLPEFIKNNKTIETVKPTEDKTETEINTEEKTEESSVEISEEKTENPELSSTEDINTESNTMFINRVSSFPIVQQSVQAIKSTTIGNFADKTLRRVASTRLPVISVPKLTNIPKMVGINKDSEEEKKEMADSHPNGITIEDMTKNIPGLATMNSIGCKTLDKLEENFPMINDPKLLEKILNRIEELKEIGENTAVVQSSLNSLQNVQNRLTRYNSVIVKKDHTNQLDKNTPSIKHRHSYSESSTTKVKAATTTIHNKHFMTTSTYQSTTTSTSKTAFETNNCCCCHCHCHEKHNTTNSINTQKVKMQQKKGFFSMLNKRRDEYPQQKPEKAKFFLRRSQKPIAFKEITSIRSNLQNNINSIPSMMYSHISNVLTTIEKKLLNSTELEKEIRTKIEHQQNSQDSIGDQSNFILNDISRISSDPNDIITPSSTESTSIITTTATTTSTITSTIITDRNSQSEASSLPPYQHYRMTSVSDSETEGTVYNPSVNSPAYTPSSSLSMINTSSVMVNSSKPIIEIKDNDPSQINININGDGAHVHDLYSFLEEVNKLLTIYLVTRKKTDQNDQDTSISLENQ